MSSKKKKNASCGRATFQSGKGTCQVDMPMASAIGWNRTICKRMPVQKRFSSINAEREVDAPQAPRW